MLGGAVTPSLENCISVNVDGSGSESGDVSPHGDGLVIADSTEYEGHDNDDAETASIHSESTDGGKSRTQLSYKLSSAVIPTVLSCHIDTHQLSY